MITTMLRNASNVMGGVRPTGPGGQPLPNPTLKPTLPGLPNPNQAAPGVQNQVC